MPVDVCVYVISRSTAGFEIDIKKRTYVRPVYNFSAYGSFAGRTAVIRPTMLCRQWLIATFCTWPHYRLCNPNQTCSQCSEVQCMTLTAGPCLQANEQGINGNELLLQYARH